MVVVDVVVGGAVVVVLVLVVVVVVLVVVVTDEHTFKLFDNKYTFPPLVPDIPFDPDGFNVCDELGTNPIISCDKVA